MDFFISPPNQVGMIGKVIGQSVRGGRSEGGYEMEVVYGTVSVLRLSGHKGQVSYTGF